MKYLLAIVIPPAGMLLCGRPVQAVLCGIVFLASLIGLPFGIGVIGWVLCSVWAVIAVAVTDPVKHNLEEMRAFENRPEPNHGVE